MSVEQSRMPKRAKAEVTHCIHKADPFPRSHQSGMRLNHNKQISFETSGFST